MKKITFDLINQIVTILSTGTSLFSFLIITLCTNTKSSTFIEYTDLSKFFLNLYIFIILLLCFIHSISPNLNCSLIKEGFGIITTMKGKIIVFLAIDIMYYSTESMPQKLFGMITFVTVLALFLANIVFNCDILKQKPLEENKTNGETEQKIDSDTKGNFNVENKI